MAAAVIGFGRTRRRRMIVVSAVASLAAAAPAVAYVCHPDPPGTRLLSLRGSVEIRAMRGAHVALSLDAGRSCRAISWNVSSGKRSSSARPCNAAGRTSAQATRGAYRGRLVGPNLVISRYGRVVHTISIGYSPPALLAAAAGRRVFVLTARAPNGPARFLGFDTATGRRTLDYPVPYSASSLDIASGVAIFQTTGHGGLYGLRLSDGRIAFLGADRRHDNPQIESPGIVYQDNLYPRKARAGIASVKFVPIAAVRKGLARVGTPMRAPGRIRTFSMDGPRVSLAVAGEGRACDRILYWNIPWHFTSFITQPTEREATCRNGRTRQADVRSIALGGLGSEWVLQRRNGAALVRSNSVACVERVLATGRIGLVAGDKDLLAYVRRSFANRWTINAANWATSRQIASTAVRPRALSADAGQIAILGADGSVRILSRWGSVLATMAAPGATSLVLSGGRLTVLTRSHRLEVFDARTGALRRVWRLPANARGPVDVHYGVAVLTRGSSVLGVRLATGRMAVLARAPRAVRAQIEAPGVAYAYDVRGRGVVKFVPLVKIERLLGKLSRA